MIEKTSRRNSSKHTSIDSVFCADSEYGIVHSQTKVILFENRRIWFNKGHKLMIGPLVKALFQGVGSFLRPSILYG